jgi:hypothetical protein
MEKVTLEVGWLSLAHNLLKQAAMEQKSIAAILHQRENRCYVHFLCYLGRRSLSHVVENLLLRQPLFSSV